MIVPKHIAGVDDKGVLVVYQKTADVCKNRIIIPKHFVDKYGREFYMDVYKDKLVIRPKKENEVK